MNNLLAASLNVIVAFDKVTSYMKILVALMTYSNVINLKHLKDLYIPTVGLGIEFRTIPHGFSQENVQHSPLHNLLQNNVS